MAIAISRIVADQHERDRLASAGSGPVIQEGIALMKRLQDYMLRIAIWKDTSGQDLVEYALAAGMVAVAAVAAMPGLSATVNNVFNKIGSIVTANVK